MLIRDATFEDLPDVVGLAVEMHAESRFSVLSFNPDKVFDMMNWCIDNRDGLLLIAEDSNGETVGAFAAYSLEHWFSNDRVSCDLGLFVRRDRRGSCAAVKLLKRYVQWAACADCKLIEIGVNTGVNMEKTSTFFEAVGFEKVGALHCYSGGI